MQLCILSNVDLIFILQNYVCKCTLTWSLNTLLFLCFLIPKTARAALFWLSKDQTRHGLNSVEAIGHAGCNIKCSKTSLDTTGISESREGGSLLHIHMLLFELGGKLLLASSYNFQQFKTAAALMQFWSSLSNFSNCFSCLFSIV